MGLTEVDAGAGSGITTTIQQLFQVAGVTFLTAIAIEVTGGVGFSTIHEKGFVVAFALAAVLMLIGALVVVIKRHSLIIDETVNNRSSFQTSDEVSLNAKNDSAINPS